MTDDAYITAYRKLSDRYANNELGMADYLAAVQKLKGDYLKGKNGTALPVVP